MSRVAIVGGGWAGLACAVELVRQGRPVTLFEAARQLGGRARRVDWDGLAIDNGQHLMIGAYSQTLALMARLGTLETLERRPLCLRVPGFELRLPRLPAPWHLVFGLLAARGLGLADKLAAARFMSALRALGFRLPADMPAADLLARHRQSTALIERLWGPICIAALNTPLGSASAQVFCNVLRDSLAGPRAASDLLLNRADLGRLVPDAAASFISRHGGSTRLGVKIEALRRDGATYHLDGPDFLADQVVLACHPSRLPALLAHLPELDETLAQVGGYAWQPILTLWLRFATRLDFPFPMLGLGEGHAPWAFERDDIAPGTVAIVVSAEGPHLERAPAALRDDYLELLRRALGPLPVLSAWKLISEKRATYACVPDQPRPAHVTPLPGLYLAGDYTAGDYPATIEGAVLSGVECARRLVADPLECSVSSIV